MEKEQAFNEIEKIKQACIYALKCMEKNEDLITINENLKKINNFYKADNKKLLKQNKILNKELTKLQSKSKKEYKWDKDCVYYYKCKKINNAKCHICRETGKYFYE